MIKTLLLLSPFFVMVSLFVGVSLMVKNRPGPQVQAVNYLPLTTSYSTSIAHSPGLNIIYIPFRNPGLQNTDSYHVDLADDSNILAMLSFSGANIGDPADLRVQFAPLTTSAPLTLVLTRTSLAAPDLLVGVDATGSLAYRTYFRPASPIGHIRSDVSSLVSRLLGDWPFVLLWATLLGLVGIRIYN